MPNLATLRTLYNYGKTRIQFSLNDFHWFHWIKWSWLNNEVRCDSGKCVLFRLILQGACPVAFKNGFAKNVTDRIRIQLSVVLIPIRSKGLSQSHKTSLITNCILSMEAPRIHRPYFSGQILWFFSPTEFYRIYRIFRILFISNYHFQND